MIIGAPVLVAAPLLVVGWLVGRALLVLIRRSPFERYWRKQRQVVAVPRALKLVVFGDSVAQGIGASHPRYSLVGRVAGYLETQTNRPVHIANYSQWGATASDIINKQLPKANLKTADIILFEIGVNDSYKRSVEEFEADMKVILAKLPLEKTVVADIPYTKLRPKYQKVASRLIAQQAQHIAYPSKVFIDLVRDVSVTAGDFFHPNNKGYALWFTAFQPGIDEVIKSRVLK